MMSGNNELMWRDTGYYPKLGPIDARCLILVFPFFMHISYTTFVLCITSIIIFDIIQRQGISIYVAIIMIRTFVMGDVRPAYDTRTFRKRCWYQ